MSSTADIDRILTDSASYRDAATMRALLRRIAATVTRPWGIMEVCGGQTFTLSRYRLEELLPPQVKMIHGPGCPVCVTPEEVIDAAIELALRPGTVLCSFGDMLRVPGSRGSLLRAKAEGADIRLLYTPLEALAIARRCPDKEVVFLAIGFETTAPLYALMVKRARALGVCNLSLITSLYTVPAAVKAIANDPGSHIDALLAAGHVCAVTGTKPYASLAGELQMPVVVTGFEPVDMLYGILKAVAMLESNHVGVVNAYRRVVAEDGNPAAMADVEETTELCDTSWRGIGTIAMSGRHLRPDYEQYDALKRFNINPRVCAHTTPCIAARIMKGNALPTDCPCFGTDCTPEAPVGAPMVSGEGVCAAYYRYNH